MRSLFCSLALILVLISGCGIAPQTSSSHFNLPCLWQSPLSEGMHEQPVNGFVWWKELNDPILDSLIERAWCRNLDLHLAKMHILEMRFEMQARYQAAKEAFYETWNQISADVATNYILLRQQQHLLKIVNKNIAIQQDAVALTQDLLQIGMSSTIEQQQTEQQLSFLQAKQPQIERSINKLMYRLSVLIGSPPQELVCELKTIMPLPTIPANKPIGMPSELLQRRPDVRKAEQEMAAALEIEYLGVGNLFPHLSLEGFLGYVSGISKIKVQEAYYQYQKVVLNALEETENAIDEFYFGLENNRSLLDALKSDLVAYESMRELYEKGFKSDFEVLALHRALLASKETYMQSNAALLLQYIALYKSLGSPPAHPSCPSPCPSPCPSSSPN